jgi:beta-lactamase superfamily II metal-dependent hydrolase
VLLRWPDAARDASTYADTNRGSPVPTAPPTPTPVPTAYAWQQLWADVDCDNQVNPIDGLKLLRYDAGLGVSYTGPCPHIGNHVQYDGAELTWGDVDCDDVVIPVDGLKVLRHDAGLSVSHTGDCPELGSPPSGGETLRVHHIDAEQGDAALIVSPGGEVAMIDTGRWTNCGNVVGYVSGLGVDHLDYHFATHYDADHIGCLDDLVADGVTVDACIDRGGSASTQVYQDYAQACAGKRQTGIKGQVVSLAGNIDIEIVDLNGAGISTTEENALGLVLKVSYGAFDHEFAGDLTGESPDIESVVAPQIGEVEVCKVHHHGSASSGNENWVDATSPEVCILSVGGNPYGHPTAEALSRLHSAGVELYWTNQGSGVAPDPQWDTVCGGAIEVVAQASGSYSVSCQ